MDKILVKTIKQHYFKNLGIVNKSGILLSKQLAPKTVAIYD